MNNKFDELTKELAESVTRRGAMKKFGLGLAGMALACFGLPNRAKAATFTGHCEVDFVYRVLTGVCIANTDYCLMANSADCKVGKNVNNNRLVKSPCTTGPDDHIWALSGRCSFSV